MIINKHMLGSILDFIRHRALSIAIGYMDKSILTGTRIPEYLRLYQHLKYF